MSKKDTATLLGIIATGVIALLALVLWSPANETGVTTYALVALLTLLAAIAKGVLDKLQKE